MEDYLKNHISQDKYYWMNNRDDDRVRNYLKIENVYTDSIMNPEMKIQEELFKEILKKYPQTEVFPKIIKDRYEYFSITEREKNYPIYLRKNKEKEDVEVILDLNEIFQTKKIIDFSEPQISPDNEKIIFALDGNGNGKYDIYIKDNVKNKNFDCILKNTTGEVVWSSDSQSFLYIKKSQNLRDYKVFYHELGKNQKDDILIFHEKDTSFNLEIAKTKDKRFVFIISSSTLSDEYRFVSSNDLLGDWKIIQPREKNLKYGVESYQDRFFILTNEGKATNFKLIETEINSSEKENWKIIVENKNDVLIEDFEIFDEYLVLEERKNGLLQIKIIHRINFSYYYLPFQEETYTAFIDDNFTFDTDILRYGYSSMTRPLSIFEFNMKTKEQKLIYEKKIEGDFDSSHYCSERLWADSRDGKTKIPISIVYSKNIEISEKTPLLMYGYGSYGYTIDATFSTELLSLLDRGFIFAIAHIRGGEYLGRQWYEDGKLLKKKNTFFDFIDSAKYLIEKKYTSSQHLYGIGDSAGGLLMGALMNYEPNLFHGIVAQVPFVDVVTTMLDESIPLTTMEYDEWGNPNDEEYFHYMKSYSPYDNVEAKDYPHLLVTTGFNDAQVQYWEPAKWVAKLRELKTDQNILILKTDFDSGHSGSSAKDESLKEVAFIYSFLLKLENLRK